MTVTGTGKSVSTQKILLLLAIFLAFSKAASYLVDLIMLYNPLIDSKLRSAYRRSKFTKTEDFSDMKERKDIIRQELKKQGKN